MDISRYLNPNLIVFLSTETREQTLREMIRVVSDSGRMIDQEEFYQAILDREKIVSTGIGMGVAIPHAKLLHLQDFFIVLAVLRKPIHWAALDGTGVRIVFMIGGPDDKQTEYLQILSQITHAIRNEEVRKKLVNSHQVSEVVELFKTI